MICEKVMAISFVRMVPSFKGRFEKGISTRAPPSLPKEVAFTDVSTGLEGIMAGESAFAPMEDDM